MPIDADDPIEVVVARWSDPARRPLFKGSLIDDSLPDGPCYCAQGDLLRHEGGVSDEWLREVDQRIADKRVADLLGISLTHSVLLRVVNDSQDGCPQDVLQAPEKVLGDQAPLVLAFWRRLDRMSSKEWAAAWAAARDAAWDAARDDARDDAGAAAGAAAQAAAWDAAWDAAWAAAQAAAWATNEIQGAALMRERGQPFFFLPIFWIKDPEELRRAEEEMVL